VVFVLLFWMHGTLYLALKVDGPLRQEAHRLAGTLVWPTIAAGAAFLLWFQLAHSHTWLTLVPVAAAAAALLAVVPLNRARREGWAFAATTTAIAGASLALFGGLFPYVLPATNDPANSLSLAHAASTEHTLTGMLVALAVLLPVVLASTVWTWRGFRYRIADESAPAPGEGLLEAAKQSYRRTFQQS